MTIEWLCIANRGPYQTCCNSIFDRFPFHLTGLGHRRPDLTSKAVLFYRVFSYLIVYLPGTKPIEIPGVLDGKRNVAHVLKQRL